MDLGPAGITLSYLKNQRLNVDYCYIASTTLLLYDLLLTLHLELKLIWFSPWNLIKVLYLLTRYLPIFNTYFILRSQLQLGTTADACSWTYRTAGWLLVIGIFFAELLLLLRTWAIWHRNKYVGIGLCVLMVTTLIIGTMGNANFLNSLQFAQLVYPESRGCYVVYFSKNSLYDWIVLVVVDFSVLFLMLVSAYRWCFHRLVHYLSRTTDRESTGRLCNPGELSDIIHRDGILFYIYLLCLTVVNVVMTTGHPFTNFMLLMPFQGVLYSVFTTRVILNLRAVAIKNSYNTEGLTVNLWLSTIEFQPFPNLNSTIEMELPYETNISDRIRPPVSAAV